MTPAPAETLTLLPESTPVLRFVYTSDTFPYGPIRFRTVPCSPIWFLYSFIQSHAVPYTFLYDSYSPKRFRTVPYGPIQFHTVLYGSRAVPYGPMCRARLTSYNIFLTFSLVFFYFSSFFSTGDLNTIEYLNFSTYCSFLQNNEKGKDLINVAT